MSRLVLVTLAGTAVLVALVVGLMLTVLLPRTDDAVDGARSVRLSHLSMVDQQTGLRAFLITGETALLDPYRTGSRQLPRHNRQARQGSMATRSSSRCSTRSSAGSGRGSSSGRTRRCACCPQT